MRRPAGRSLLPKPVADIAGRRAGVLTGISGLDRIALSRYLRANNVEVTIVANAAELVDGLRARPLRLRRDRDAARRARSPRAKAWPSNGRRPNCRAIRSCSACGRATSPSSARSSMAWRELEREATSRIIARYSSRPLCRAAVRASDHAVVSFAQDQPRDARGRPAPARRDEAGGREPERSNAA